MQEAVEDVVRDDPRIEYALVFGSHARGTQRTDSDLDVCLELSQPIGTHEMLDLCSRLEGATGRDVDLVLINEAPPPLAYRIFKEGVVVFERNHDAFVRRKAKAILDYLDFQPIEKILVRGALSAAKRG